MKKVNIQNNCISTQSSCVDWSGGDLPSLGICNGDPLNKVVVEIVDKLEEIAGDNLASFDIDELLDICNQSAPLEVNLISILTLLKKNDVCLKDYIDTLNDKINELMGQQDVSVNLKCYADIDNLGNSLSITRDELDQLVINELCDHKNRISSAEGKLIALQAQVNAINPTATVEELEYATCVNPSVVPNSIQVKSTAAALCEMKTSIGTPTHIAQAVSKVPQDWNTKFGLVSGWDLTPDNFAQNYGNALLVIANLEARLSYIESTCCAIDCESVKIGYFVTSNEEGNGIIFRFTTSAGTAIPAGFTDKGSTGTITDRSGNVQNFSFAVSNGVEIEIPISGLDGTGKLEIDLNTKVGNGTLLCDKCSNRTIELSGGCCVLTNISTTDTTIIYESII